MKSQGGFHPYTPHSPLKAYDSGDYPPGHIKRNHLGIGKIPHSQALSFDVARWLVCEATFMQRSLSMTINFRSVNMD